MNQTTFVITEFLTESIPINHKGVSFRINRRESSALVFPIHGKLEFIQGGKAIFCDSENPVFIPEGASYTNKCTEDSQSLMFNIRVQSSTGNIIQLLPVDKNNLKRIYDEIAELNTNCTMRKQARIFEKLYRIISECMPHEAADSSSLLSPALEFIEKNYFQKNLSLDDLAEKCNISKPYLHKLFKKEFEITPFQYIAQVRMRKAKTLLQEMYPVGDVALQVGYSDIYQFSRAFKKLVGLSPLQYRQLNLY